MAKDKLTPKQAAFVREYLLCRNGTEAARRAGYKGNQDTLKQVASENLAKPYIFDLVKENEQKLEEEFEITQSKIVQELAAIAFGHAGKVMDWREGSVSLIPRSEMSETDMKFIDSITETSTEFGGSVSMKTMAGQKTKALELLGKHIGMWKDGSTGTDKDSKRDVMGRLQNYFSKHRKDRSGSGT